jgi:hypothetical protein
MQAMDIIAANNNAVNLMRQGSFHTAILSFHSALRELHRITGVQQQNMKVDHTRAPIAPSANHNSGNRDFVRKVKGIPLGDTLQLSICQDQDAFSIFDRAFFIHSSASASIYYREGQNFTTTVLLYNMGLAYQLLGMQDFPSRQRNLKKATKVYRMAAAILSKSGDDANDLVFLAVSNNMGHIYSHFCDTQESQRCLDSLRAGLHAIQQDSKVEILEDEFRAFQMNVLIMHGQNKVTAAAA